jgi:plastocyanin
MGEGDRLERGLNDGQSRVSELSVAAMSLPFRRPIPFVAACAVLCAVTSSAWAKEHKVSIQNVKYDPKEIRIKKGDTVTWTNGDDRDHTVTADDGSFASKNLGNGNTFSHKFPKAGKFKYHCEYHPRMKAIVIVEE